MKLPFEINLTGKVCVITGAGGVLCSMFAEALAKTGAKIALLDLNEEAAKTYAEKIVNDGGIAKGYACNVQAAITPKQLPITNIFHLRIWAISKHFSTLISQALNLCLILISSARFFLRRFLQRICLTRTMQA